MDSAPRRERGKTREIVRRFYLRGLTLREIAERTGISTQAVSAHVRSLREAGELEGRRPA